MDPWNNTETEEETIAEKKKRARRVSFADNEITSVHIFRRDDEDSETPPPSSAQPEQLGFFRDLAGHIDDDDDADLKGSSSPSRSRNADDGQVVDSFLRPLGSPSPGSSTAGSAASTEDEADFHGPVSASFIRPERLSDSGASDDNHDLTMDSTAFSLHYRSLARSDSGDLKTPTRFGLQFDEKTPSQTCSPAAPGSFMVLTKDKKQSSLSPVPVDLASAGRDSNDMSIVGENSQRYDYDRLSPTLDAILAEGSKDLSAATDSPNRNGSIMAKGSRDSAMGNTGDHDLPVKELPEAPCKLGDLSICSISFATIDQATSDCLYNKGDNTVADSSNDQIQTPDSSIKEVKNFIEDVTTPVPKLLDFANANRGTPVRKDDGYQLNVSAQFELGYNEGRLKESSPKDRGQVPDLNPMFDQLYGNSRPGLTPSSSAERKQLFLGSPDSSKYGGIATPPLNQSGSFVPEVHFKHGESMHKSISKLKTVETTPSTSTLKEGIDRLKCRLSKYSPGSSFSNNKDCEYNHVKTLNARLEEQPCSATPDNNMHQGLISMDDHEIESFRNTSNLSQNEETVHSKKDEENIISANVSYSNENPKPVEMAASPLKMVHLYDPADSTVESRKDEIVLVTPDKSFSSPDKLFDQKLSPSVEYQRNCHGELKQLDKKNESINGDLRNASDCNSLTASKKLELSVFVNGETSSSLFESEGTRFAQSVSKRKLAESPAKWVQVPSTPIQEASQQEPASELLPSNMQDLSHKGSSDAHGPLDNRYHLALQGSESPPIKPGIEISYGKKRKGFDLVRDGNNIEKIGRIDRSSEVHGSGNGDLQLALERTCDIRSEREKRGNQILKNWADILKEFLGSINQLLSPSVDNLNSRAIGMLEDILVHLQKVKKCEILCSDINSQQKIIDPVTIPRHKRVVEARMLLHNIAYEKAKLQLLHMKRERLLKKVQMLSPGLQEASIQLNFRMRSFNSVPTFAQANDSHFHSSLIEPGEKSQVATMKQEIEVLDWKAKSLSKYFHSYCKMEGERSCADTIKSVHDYLTKRMSYKYILQNFQLWDIDDFEHKNGCYSVLLNYCGYIIQRFTINATQPNIIISSKLNDVNIVKTFPDMDALSAFVFVFNTHSPKNCSGTMCLAQETQITSLLLSNLLSVVEEVQLARNETRNLVQAKFYSHSVQQLDLQLCFIDFSSGRKAKVTLDMRCLKCGAYPAEALPSQIYEYAATCEEQRPLSTSLITEIRTAAESVRIGYSRIFRLCRYISKAVQACISSR